MSAYGKSVIQSVACSALLIALAAAPASGQTPATAAPPTSSVQTAFLGDAFLQAVTGREVWITTSNGARLKARVAAMSPTGLTVTTTNGQGQSMQFGEIARIQRVTHRIRNHMIAGLIIGGGLGLLGGAFCDSGDCFSGFVLAYAGIGVGIGALNGYIRNKVSQNDDLIYEARARTTTTMALTPILSRTRKGAAFTLTWR